RREWLSFLWPLKCSVRLAMRSERMATCTSGEPVSVGLVAYSLMRAALRSAVIDIGQSFQTEDCGTLAPGMSSRRSRNELGPGKLDRIGPVRHSRAPIGEVPVKFQLFFLAGRGDGALRAGGRGRFGL